MIFLILILVSYIIGSFPTAVWVGKIFHNIDIREHGSCNAGATNTFRVLGNKWGWIVLFVDIGKGYLAASLPFFLSSLYYGFKDEVLILQLIASLCAVVGHVFPVFANNTIHPHLFPNTRNVFVAPALRLPCSLISIL